MTQRFRNAFDALTSAYLKGELRAGDCDACAVGTIATYSGCGMLHWERALRGFRFRGECLDNILDPLTEGTGYSIKEIDQIEYTFEDSVHEEYKKNEDKDAAQYQGLVKVIELLAELDGLDIETQVETFKKEVA